jgi:hypothetical protein
MKAMPAKKEEGETTKLQVVVETKTAEKIAELAERMKVSQSKMCKLLLEAAIEDNEWMIRAVSSRFADAVRRALGAGKRTAKSSAEGA